MFLKAAFAFRNVVCRGCGQTSCSFLNKLLWWKVSVIPEVTKNVKMIDFFSILEISIDQNVLNKKRYIIVATPPNFIPS